MRNNVRECDAGPLAIRAAAVRNQLQKRRKTRTIAAPQSSPRRRAWRIMRPRLRSAALMAILEGSRWPGLRGNSERKSERAENGRTSGERGKRAPGVLHGQPLRLDHGQGPGGGLSISTGPAPRDRNAIKRKFPRNQRGEPFRKKSRTREEPARRSARKKPPPAGGLRGALRARGGSRAGIYSFLHRERPSWSSQARGWPPGCQRGGRASYRLKDGQRRRINGRALFSVKYHDGTRAPQPPLSTPPGRL